MHINSLPPEFKALFEVYGQLTEASKMKVLEGTLLLDYETAKWFDDNFKGKAVIMANKFLDYVSNRWLSGKPVPISDKTGRRECSPYVLAIQQPMLIPIKDWINVGLNGNLGDWAKSGTLEEMYQAAQAWHNELESGEGEINYQETGRIVVDFRKGGLGFYWVDLNTHRSDEECNRMGHCGTTSYGNTIYSLREYKQHGQAGHTLNESHVTAAVGRDDGIIYQMKGPHNQKPNTKFHPYILELLMKDKHLSGFGSEYDSKEDFKITDLSHDQVKKLYQARKELFNNRNSQKALVEIGILSKLPPFPAELDFFVGDIEGWLDFDVSESFVKSVLWGEFFYNFWDHTPPYSDLLDNVDTKNSTTINDIIMKAGKTKEFTWDSQEEAIEELGLNDVKYALQNAYAYAVEGEIYNIVYNNVKLTLEEFGDVEKFELYEWKDHKGNTHSDINIIVNIKDIYEVFDEDHIEQLIEYHGNDTPGEDIVKQIFHEGGKPKIYISREIDYAYPSDKDFNMHLKETLAEVD